jgi:hypothetical protein
MPNELPFPHLMKDDVQKQLTASGIVWRVFFTSMWYSLYIKEVNYTGGEFLQIELRSRVLWAVQLTNVGDRADEILRINRDAKFGVLVQSSEVDRVP